ncbi:MAG: glycosyltransferase [Roseburia sp.]|nr:glycosyltransferase [Roseburia sp.]
MKKISVIMPAYNVEPYIGRCLKSLEAQGLKDFEVIIVNDGSTDGTEKIILNYMSDSSLDIKYIYQKNAGQGYARNEGLGQAEGEYIAFIDSDDYVDSDYLQELLACAEKNEADMVSCGYRVIDEQGRVASECDVSPFARESGYGRPGIFVVWSRFFRREFLAENQIFFPEGKIYEDVPFTIDAKYRAKNVRSISYIGYNYCKHTNSTMTKARVKSDRFPMAEFDAVLKKFKTEGMKCPQDLELEVLCFFAGFLFLYCGKAEKKDVHILCEFAQKELKYYFPGYWKNPGVGICKTKELPFINRLCIKVFVVTSRLPVFKHIVYLVTRVTNG